MPAQQPKKLGSERPGPDFLRELLERAGHAVVEAPRSNRNTRGSRIAFETYANRLVVAAAHVAVIDLGPVVIFGLQPEHRHTRNAALLGEPACGRHDSGRFVDRERGACEQPYLLPGEHGRRAAARKQLEMPLARR